MEKEEILNLYWNLQSMENSKNINIKHIEKNDFNYKLRGRRRKFNNTLFGSKNIIQLELKESLNKIKKNKSLNKIKYYIHINVSKYNILFSF